MSTNKDWTDENIARLRHLWDEGYPTAQIGKMMDLSKNAVVGKARRLHLTPRPSPIRGVIGEGRKTPGPKPRAPKVTLSPLASVVAEKLGLPEAPKPTKHRGPGATQKLQPKDGRHMSNPGSTEHAHIGRVAHSAAFDQRTIDAVTLDERDPVAKIVTTGRVRECLWIDGRDRRSWAPCEARTLPGKLFCAAPCASCAGANQATGRGAAA